MKKYLVLGTITFMFLGLESQPARAGSRTPGTSKPRYTCISGNHIVGDSSYLKDNKTGKVVRKILEFEHVLHPDLSSCNYAIRTEKRGFFCREGSIVDLITGIQVPPIATINIGKPLPAYSGYSPCQFKLLTMSENEAKSLRSFLNIGNKLELDKKQKSTLDELLAIKDDKQRAQLLIRLLRQNEIDQRDLNTTFKKVYEGATKYYSQDNFVNRMGYKPPRLPVSKAN